MILIKSRMKFLSLTLSINTKLAIMKLNITATRNLIIMLTKVVYRVRTYISAHERSVVKLLKVVDIPWPGKWPLVKVF